MKFSQILFVVLMSVIITFGVSQYVVSSGSGAQETAFERVMRTGVLRCGYYNYAPMLSLDPTTKKLSGYSVDLMALLTERTGLEVEWVEEITFASWIPALQAGRFDMVCTPLWADSSYSRAAHFTRPLFFNVTEPLVRADETRFSANAEDMNNSGVTIAVQENNMSEHLADKLFPKAKKIVLPTDSDYGLLLQNVLSKKADVVMWNRTAFREYEKNNPNKLKILELNRPLKVVPCELPVQIGELDLLAFMNAFIEDMLVSGDMGRLVKKWADDPKTWPLPAPLFSFDKT